MHRVGIDHGFVVGVTGMSGSGKTTVCNALRDALGARHVSYGAYIRSVAKGREIPDGLVELQQLGLELHQSLGAIELTRLALEFAGCDSADDLLVDGIRHVDIWEAVRQLRPRAVLVYIDAEETELRRRLAVRDGWSDEYAERVHRHRLEVQVREQLRPLADVFVTSDDVPAAIDAVRSALD